MLGRNNHISPWNFAFTKRRKLALAVCGSAGVGVLVYRQQKSKQTHSSLRRAFSDVACGAVGYMAQMVVFYPVDTLKIRCQAEGIHILKCLHRIAASGKVGSLFYGIGPSAVCSCIVGGVFFSSYSCGKRIADSVIKCNLPSLHADLSLGVELFGSVLSWGVTCLVEAPLEMLRHQTQAGVLKAGIWKGIVSCFRENRILSLYCCLIPYMVKSLPFDVAELMTHGHLTSLREASSSSHLVSIPEPLWGLFAGAIAGSTAVICSMPFDCIKTRMEIQTALGTGGRQFFACGVSMVQREGLRSLWRGFIPRLVVYVPGTALFWMVVDTFQGTVK